MDEARNFAEQWIADWNSHDLDAILSHYAESARFNSPFAKLLTGDGIVEGKDGLRAYWSAGLQRRTELHFTLIGAFGGYETVAVHYSDEAGRTAVETMVFDEGGKVIVSTACYDRLK